MKHTMAKPKLPVAANPTTGDTFRGNDQLFVFPPDRGTRYWVGKAKTTSFDTGTSLLSLTGIRCQLYQDGRETLRVQADTATGTLEGDVARMSLSGHVHVVEPVRGSRLEADTFRWISTSDQITATKVRWLGGGIEHRAERGTFSTDLTRGAFSGKVSTTYENAGKAPKGAKR